MRIALTTAEHLPHGSDDDQVLIAALRARDWEPVSVIWDQPAHWQDFDIVVLRSIWDYHLKYRRFLQWLDELDAAGVPVHNNTNIVRWNADKRYLLELEQQGVRITPSRLLETSADTTLRDIQHDTGWDRLVIKPTVASTGYETWIAAAPLTASAEARLRAQHARMPLLVQQFVAGVSEGEISLVFLGGQYSHAVVKRAAGDEFRVHIEHGGTVASCQAEPALIAWGQRVLAAAPPDWTYARVDLVMEDSEPVLMELELLDPELFFQYHRPAADTMIAALGLLSDAR